MNEHAFRYIIPQLLSQGWPKFLLELCLDHRLDYDVREIPLRFKFASLAANTKRLHLIDFFLGRKTPYDSLFRKFIKPLKFEVPEYPRPLHLRLIYLNTLHNLGRLVPYSYRKTEQRGIINLTNFTYNFQPISFGFSKRPFFPCINQFSIKKQPGYILDLVDFFSFGFFYFPFCCNIPIDSRILFKGPFPYATSRSHIQQIYRCYFKIDFFYKSRDTAYHYSDIFDD